MISGNFYADINETSNKEYRSYLSWLKKVHGESSQYYNDALLDTTVFRKCYEPRFGEPYIAWGYYYFYHPGFDDYPVVGVDLLQAHNYCSWKTNVYAKALLTEKGLITNFVDSNKAHFTIEKYLQGGFDWIDKMEVLPIEKFKIPSSKEWEELAGINSEFRLGVNLSDTLKRINRNRRAFVTRDILVQDPHFSIGGRRNYENQAPAAVNSSVQNVFGLHNTVGNVSELVSNEGLSKGGNFKSDSDEITLEANNQFNEPNHWTGFRCICKYELPKTKESTNS